MTTIDFVSSMGETFTLRQFFDPKFGGGFEVKNKHIHIGEVFDFSFPDDERDEYFESDMKKFEKEMNKWLNDNYYC